MKGASASKKKKKKNRKVGVYFGYQNQIGLMSANHYERIFMSWKLSTKTKNKDFM